MKKFILFASAIVFLAGCEPKAPEATTLYEDIATDKMKVVEVLKLADTKGTVGEAFMEAAKDSSLAAKMKLAVAMMQPQSDVHSSGTTKVQPTAKKDGFDKAGDALDKTGQTMDKTGKVIDKAGDLRKKTEDMLKK